MEDIQKLRGMPVNELLQELRAREAKTGETAMAVLGVVAVLVALVAGVGLSWLVLVAVDTGEALGVTGVILPFIDITSGRKT